MGNAIGNDSANGCASLVALGVNPAPTTVTIASLAASAQYEVKVLALNAMGASNYSALANVTAAPGLASAPRTLDLKSANGGFEATWTAPADNGGGSISYYFLLYRSGSEAFPTIDAVSAACVGMSDMNKGCRRVTPALLINTMTGLQNGRSYAVRVQALNNSGLGAAAADSVRPGGPPAPIPAASFALTPRDTGFFAVWDEPDTFGLGVQYYIMRYRNASDSHDFPDLTNSGAATACPSASNTTDSGCITISGGFLYLRQTIVASLMNGKVYEAQVMAVNSLGTSLWSAVKSVRPGRAPSAPQNLRLYSANNSLAVEWDAVSDLPADNPPNGGHTILRYILLYRNASLNQNYPLLKIGASTCVDDTNAAIGSDANSGCVSVTSGASVNVSGLTNGENYETKVLAVNAIGISAYSAAVTSTPASVPSAPRSLNVNLANASFTAAWAAPANNGGSAITSYILLYRADSNSFPSVDAATNDCTGITNSAAAGCEEVSAGSTLTVDVNALTNGARYGITVQAVTANGLGLAASADIIPGTRPDAVASTQINLAAMNMGFRASWAVPATNGYPITKYILTYRNATDSVSFPSLIGSGSGRRCPTTANDNNRGCEEITGAPEVTVSSSD